MPGHGAWGEALMERQVAVWVIGLPVPEGDSGGRGGGAQPTSKHPERAVCHGDDWSKWIFKYTNMLDTLMRLYGAEHKITSSAFQFLNNLLSHNCYTDPLLPYFHPLSHHANFFFVLHAMDIGRTIRLPGRSQFCNFPSTSPMFPFFIFTLIHRAVVETKCRLPTSQILK